MSKKELRKKQKLLDELAHTMAITSTLLMQEIPHLPKKNHKELWKACGDLTGHSARLSRISMLLT